MYDIYIIYTTDCFQAIEPLRSYGQKSKQSAALGDVKQMVSAAVDYIANSGDGTPKDFCWQTDTRNKIDNIYNHLKGAAPNVYVSCYDVDSYYLNQNNFKYPTWKGDSSLCQFTPNAWIIWVRLIDSSSNNISVACVDYTGSVTQDINNPKIVNGPCLCQ